MLSSNRADVGQDAVAYQANPSILLLNRGDVGQDALVCRVHQPILSLIV